MEVLKVKINFKKPRVKKSNGSIFSGHDTCISDLA
jgi:hypothetical protein